MSMEKNNKSIFDGLNREQFKELLIEAGFEVEDGEGKLIYTDEVKSEFYFAIDSKYGSKKDEVNKNDKNMPSFPIAC